MFKTTLPWNRDVDVMMVEDLSIRLKSDNNFQTQLIPSEILLLADLDVTSQQIDCFIQRYLVGFKEAQEKWLRSIDYLSIKGLFSYSDMSRLLEKNYDSQGQIIYLTHSGSLKTIKSKYSEFNDFNTIVAGLTQRIGLLHVYKSKSDLVRSNRSVYITSVNMNEFIDWEFFTAHDPAHILFAPIPIVLEELCFEDTSYSAFRFGKVEDVRELSINDLAKLKFGMIELIVSGLNQQGLQNPVKNTQTGLTLFETVRDLFSFIKFAKILFPDLGFEETERLLNANNFYFERKPNNLVITELCAPCLRVLSSRSCLANTTNFIEFYDSCFQNQLQEV